MEPSKDEIRRDIEATRAAMAEKIQTLEARVGSTIQEAKRSVNPVYQTQKHPLRMVGLAMAVGYLFDRLLFCRPQTSGQGRKFPIDPERRAYLEGKEKGGGFIRAVATAAGVALARNYATNLASKPFWSSQTEKRP